MTTNDDRLAGQPRSIVIVSGGVGASGSLLVQTALAQFPDVEVSIAVLPSVEHDQQIDDIISHAAATRALVVHTLVAPKLRQRLCHFAAERGVSQVDLMGPLLSELATFFTQAPLGQAGRYRRLHEEDVKRIEAIEYTVAHDDGQRRHEWNAADIVIVGVSRVGKTPVSIYLSMLGWKVANVPLIPDIPPPPELLEIDRRRVVGLMIDSDQLMLHRAGRLSQLHVIGSSYTHHEALQDELESARRLFRHHGIPVIDATTKAVETTANDVLAVVRRRGGITTS